MLPSQPLEAGEGWGGSSGMSQPLATRETAGGQIPGGAGGTGGHMLCMYVFFWRPSFFQGLSWSTAGPSLGEPQPPDRAGGRHPSTGPFARFATTSDFACTLKVSWANEMKMPVTPGPSGICRRASNHDVGPWPRTYRWHP